LPSAARLGSAAAHDHEKWISIFGQDHAQTQKGLA
jgi:hypothetical protein